MNEALQRIEKARATGATTLDLSELGLAEIPDSIRDLKQLLELRLEGNELSVLPESLRQLTQLQSLNVSENQLAELPEWLGQLSQLQDLKLSQNQLTALPENLDRLTRVQSLDIWGNQLTSLPEWLGRLGQLQSLDVSLNRLSALPESLGRLSQLRRLDMVGINLSALPEWLGRLTRLQHLDVAHNQLTALPEGLGRLTLLRHLDISNNQLAVLPEGLCQLTQLQSLNISRNELIALPKCLGQLTQLRDLDISRNELTALPESLIRLMQLQDLNVAQNKLTTLPQWLGHLTLLRKLNVSKNELTALPEYLGQLTRLQNLDASRNELTALPKSLDQLTQLRSFDVSDNHLAALPEWLGQLTELQALDTSQNELTALPSCLDQLTHLQSLDISNNHLAALPKWLGQLTQLRVLAASNNQLTDLPESLAQCRALLVLDVARNNLAGLPIGLRDLNLRTLWLQDNPRLGLSSALLGEYPLPYRPGMRRTRSPDPRVILDAFFSAQTLDGKPLNEVKLVLVGRGAAGKTTLAYRLMKNRFRRTSKETQGIDITRWPLVCGSQQVAVNIWDFAGQVVTHSTHHFFLSESSVYVLVLTGREDTQKHDADYWLRLIRAFATGQDGRTSPVIVALNKYEEHPFRIDRNMLREKYPFIVDFVETDCKSGLGIPELKARLSEVIAGMDIVRQKFKLSWWKIKQQLEKAQRKQHYFPYSTFQKICDKEGETDPARQRFLADVFHALGVALNYGRDVRLRDATVLNPRWVTESIYTLLREGVSDDGSALLTFARVRQLLPGEPEDMQRYLVELMRRFDLAFPLNEEENEWLVPQRLPAEQPDLGEEWLDVKEATRLRFTYPVVPEGLLPSFISRTYPLSEAAEDGGTALPRWANGVVLADRGAKALVRVDIEERRVNVVVTGEREARLSLLGVIQADFRTIHQKISGLGEVEELELENSPGVYVRVKTLRADELRRQPSSASTEQGTIPVNATDELNRLSEPRARQENQWRPSVFISYSSRDARFKDELLIRLKPLQETHGLLEIWHDRCIPPGGDWDGEIREELEAADVVLFLVSSRFLASDYIRGVEVARAVERANERKAHLIPIILERADFEKEPFGKFNALPRKGVPIRDAKPQRNAWYEVATELRQQFERMIREKQSTMKVDLSKHNALEKI